MGRKKLETYMKKSEYLRIRMTKNELDILKKLAEKKRLSMSELIRNLVIDEYLKN